MRAGAVVYSSVSIRAESVIMLPLWLFVLIFTALLIGAYKFYKGPLRVRRHVLKIPGPPLKPIVGNLFEALTVKRDALFKRDSANCLKYYPIYREQILHIGLICPLSPPDIEIVLSGMKHVQKSSIYELLHMWLGQGLLTSEGAKWQNRRKILTPAFHFTILQEFIKIFNESAYKLVKDLEQNCNKALDIVPFVTECTLRAITETSMGLKLNSKSDSHLSYKNAVYEFGIIGLYRLTRPWLHNKRIFLLTPLGRKAKKVVETLHQFTTNVIEERKRNFKSESYSSRKKLAMLDLLLKAKEEGENLDDNGIREEVDTFMFEGHDTTSVALTFILMVLANETEIQSEVRREIMEILGASNTNPSYSDLQQLHYTERVLKECLRLYPSVPFISRVASEDFTTATGYFIAKGTMINLHIFDIHRNPNVFQDPLKFDPDRFLPENIAKRHPYAFIPFSAGPRNCIGQKFAMLEMKAVVCAILMRFELEAVDRPEDLVFVSDLVLRTEKNIRLKLKMLQ